MSKCAIKRISRVCGILNVDHLSMDGGDQSFYCTASTQWMARNYISFINDRAAQEEAI